MTTVCRVATSPFTRNRRGVGWRGGRGGGREEKKCGEGEENGEGEEEKW